MHEEQLDGRRLHPEHFRDHGGECRRDARRAALVAVGTTSVRTLESAVAREGPSEPLPAKPNLSSIQDSIFARAGAMLTNFHLPRTSLLLLVCAFAGNELDPGGLPPCCRASGIDSIPTAIAC